MSAPVYTAGINLAEAIMPGSLKSCRAFYIPAGPKTKSNKKYEIKERRIKK
jgi:hypothetical protein